MRNKQGFSLLELMLTMFIMAIVLALTGPVYISVLTGVQDEKVSSTVYQDVVGSVNLLRLDLEHIGHGVGSDETSMPITWNEATSTLELRSLLNNTNELTMGWGLLDCSAGNFIVNELLPAATNLVLLDEGKTFNVLTTVATPCPAAATNIFTAYSYDPDPVVANRCVGGGWCTQVTYQLRDANPAPVLNSDCAQGTFNFVREVSTNGFTGDAIISCVSDFKVRFDIDLDANGIITGGEAELNALPVYASTGNMMTAIKNIKVYLLVQAGGRDEDLNSLPNTTVGTVNPVVLSTAGVVNANQYRWKVVQVSGKPMGW